MNFQSHSGHIKGLFIYIYKPVLLMEVHSLLLFYLFWHELLNVLILSQSLKYEDKEFYIQHINASNHTLLIQY
jgi:hypothetical protein